MRKEELATEGWFLKLCTQLQNSPIKSRTVSMAIIKSQIILSQGEEECSKLIYRWESSWVFQWQEFCSQNWSSDTKQRWIVQTQIMLIPTLHRTVSKLTHNVAQKCQNFNLFLSLIALIAQNSSFHISSFCNCSDDVLKPTKEF